MKLDHLLVVTIATASIFFFPNVSSAQENPKKGSTLDKKQQAIIIISAFTAKGDLPSLREALNSGLDAGLTVNEIKEILVQLYAYAGFPRSLNGINTFMAVLKDRKEKGISDAPGKEPSPLPANRTMLELGTELQTKLVGRPVQGEVYQFAPAIDQYLKVHLFGAIFGRDNLDWKTREIATISALAALGGAENQLRSHFTVEMNNGLSEDQLVDLVSIIHSQVGSNEGMIAKEVLQTVLNRASNDNPATTESVNPITTTIFPKGEKITNNNFVGNAWLNNLVTSDSTTAVGNVTFHPGARTNWHSHPGGQILLVTGGVGYYQEKGSSKKIINKGDVIKCPPNVLHWHGANPDNELIHIAITDRQKGLAVWAHPVTDEEYHGK